VIKVENNNQAMSVLEIRDMEVERGGKKVLKLDHFSLRKGETLAVIGPNGAGKSTLLLALARIIKPTRGEFIYEGKKVRNAVDLDYRRQISLVLQDPLLLKTSVFDNIATGLRFRRVSRKKIQTTVDYWMNQLDIHHLKKRSSHQLSGGEAQRVSIARALAINPRILMLDEPFRSLDSPTRIRILDDFRALLAELDMAVLFVTHDMDEAMALGDRIAVILNGEIRQIGTPEQVFNSPSDIEVAELVGVETVMVGNVIHHGGSNVVLDVCGIQIEAVGSIYPGQEAFILVRPEDVTIWMGGELPASSARNCLEGSVIGLTPQRQLVRVIVECRGKENEQCVHVTALITKTSADQLDLSPGKGVSLTFKASAVHLIPRKF
jgi:tungstate transport system ATP-binding protein